MKRGISIAAAISTALLLVGLFAFLTRGVDIPVLQPSGEVAASQQRLMLFTVALSLLVVLPVFGLLGFIAVKYRAGNTKAKYLPDWGENRLLEGLWWGIPILIIGILGVVTYQTSHSLDPYKPLSGDDPVEVQVVALRWKWLFIYPEERIATLNHLHIPVDRPVKFTMTANAPMSAFWIPALGSQVYAMNGMASELNLKATKLGEYTGYTTNINGEGYAKMTFRTAVVNDKQYADWATSAARSDDAMTRGVYDSLSEPKAEHDERTYYLADTGLFHSIAGQHSHGGAH